MQEQQAEASTHSPERASDQASIPSLSPLNIVRSSSRPARQSSQQPADMPCPVPDVGLNRAVPWQTADPPGQSSSSSSHNNDAATTDDNDNNDNGMSHHDGADDDDAAHGIDDDDTTGCADDTDMEEHSIQSIAAEQMDQLPHMSSSQTTDAAAMATD